MIVGRAAEGFEIYRVVARVTAQEVGGQRLRSVEIQPGVLVNLRDARICVRDAARESRRVLRGFGEEEAVRNRVEVDVFRQMARERADIADAQHRIESEVMLHLQAEALHVRDVAAEIGAANRARVTRRRGYRRSERWARFAAPISKRGLTKVGGCSTDGKITLLPDTRS